MIQEIKFKEDATPLLLKGINSVADAVKSTFGPNGRNVIIEDPSGESPHITKDGVTVAASINLENKYENIGASLIKEVALKTCKDVGDGTTTSTILTQFIINEGIKAMSYSSNNTFALKRGMDKATNAIVDNLKSSAINISSMQDIFNISMVSTNGDEDLSKLLSTTFDKIGKDGVLVIDETGSSVTEVELTEGLQIDSGYYVPLFCTTSPTITYDNPYILICTKKIAELQEIQDVLRKVMAEKRPLLIIAPDYSTPILNTLIANNANGILEVCAIKAPGFNEQQQYYIEDISVYIGQSVVGKAVTKSLGLAKAVVIGRESTTILHGAGTTKELQDRVEYLKGLIEVEKVEGIKTRIQERIARLNSSVAFLHIGAISEVELKERKDRIDDAINAIKAALNEGIVIGSGIALLRASKVLDNIIVNNKVEQIGVDIIKNAARQLIQLLLINAEEDLSIINKLYAMENHNDIGYNTDTKEFENFLENGIIDPVKVVYASLQNAVSVASLFLTTNCVIINK